MVGTGIGELTPVAVAGVAVAGAVEVAGPVVRPLIERVVGLVGRAAGRLIRRRAAIVVITRAGAVAWMVAAGRDFLVAVDGSRRPRSRPIRPLCRMNSNPMRRAIRSM